MFFRKECETCRKKIGKGGEIERKVDVYGRVGKWKKTFCSVECLEKYTERTEQLMKTRRPNVCMKCLR